MNHLPISKAEEKESAQQLAVLLTLATEQLPQAGPCPDPATLTAMMEGRLPTQQRSILMEHLDQCPACYRAWLGTAALQPSQKTGHLVLFRRALHQPALAAMALAASLLLILVQWNPLAPDLPGMLASAYQAALQQGLPHPGDPSLPFSMTGKDNKIRLGFASPDDPAPIRQAFEAGARMGWEEMNGSKAQSVASVKPEWMVYQHLGRWTILLQTLCQTTPPPINLLRQQAPLGEAIGMLLAKREATGEAEARIPHREVTVMQQLLNTADSAEPAQRLCRQIQAACATIIEGLLL